MMAKINRFSRLQIVTVFTISVALFLVSCGQADPTGYVMTDDAEATVVETVDEESSSVLVPTYYELTQLSDIVVMGHVRAEVGVINTARYPADISRPDPRSFTIAVVYAIDVEEYLAGDGPRTIYLARWEGSIDHGTTPSPAEIDQARAAASANALYTSFDSHKTYLMFLRSIQVWEDYAIAELEEGNLFVRTANPWLFDASDPMSVFVVGVTSGIEQIYPPQPLAEITAQMNDPARTPPSVLYPVPLESPLQQFEPTAPLSYPMP
jgi:hypothetical protein